MYREKKLRIVQIIPTLNIAGAERMASQLAIYQRKMGHDVYFINFYNVNTSITEELRKEGIEIIYLNKKRGFDITIIFKLWSHLKRIGPDIIHTHLNTLVYVALPSLFMNIPLIHTVHNIAEKEIPYISSKVHKYLYNKKRAIPIAISPIINKTICNFYKMQEKQVPTIYNGINLSNCKKKELYSNNINTILHIGRFSEQKNHEMLIEAFSKLVLDMPHTKLLLAGDGELRSEVEKKIKKLHLESNIKLLGVVDNVFDLLHSVDLFVLPSKYEGFPITLIEALGTGIPVIATDVGGVRDIITDQYSGLLCELDPEDLVNKIKRLNDDNELYMSIAQNALRTANMFSVEEMTRNYIDIYIKQLN